MGTPPSRNFVGISAEISAAFRSFVRPSVCPLNLGEISAEFPFVCPSIRPSVKFGGTLAEISAEFPFVRSSVRPSVRVKFGGIAESPSRWAYGYTPVQN